MCQITLALANLCEYAELVLRNGNLYPRNLGNEVAGGLGTRLQCNMAEEAMQSAAGAAAAAARGAVDVCLSGGAFGGFKFSLKIDNPWLAAGIAIGTFYIANKALSERAIRNALQQQTSPTANADPEVTSISTGSILVQLQCHTEESFFRFTDDIDSKKAKYRLEEELARVGFREEIRLIVENKEELEIFRYAG